MKKIVDINTWKGRTQYLFFKDFEEPFHGVCVRLDCSETYKEAKQKGISLFLLYTHKMLKAVNACENFRYRIEENDVVLYDTVNISVTIAKEDNTFVFTDFLYDSEFSLYEKDAKQKIEEAKKCDMLVPCIYGEQTILTSTLPWIDFSSLSHARVFKSKGTAPRITFGKITEDKEGRLSMPVSIHAHHAFVDGRSIGEFIDLFQQELNNPSCL